MKDTNSHPPALAIWLFRQFCGDALVEDLLGDLDEIYFHRISKGNRFGANVHYWKQVISLIFSYGIVRRKKDAALPLHYHRNRLDMFRNYIKISYRSLKKQRTFAILNMVGLAMGMSVTLIVLALYVDVSNFDNFHQDQDRIYRVVSEIEENGDSRLYASSSPGLHELLASQIPDIENSVRINNRLHFEVKKDNNSIDLNGYFAEPSFFDLFNFPFAAGNAQSALTQPNGVVLSAKTAKLLFNDTDPVGQVLETQHGPFTVTGVLEEGYKNTHFWFDIIASYSYTKNLIPKLDAEKWTENRGNFMYLKLTESADAHEVEERIGVLASAGEPFFEEKNIKTSFSLQSLAQINPGPIIYDPIGVSFEGPIILFILAVSLLILLPACFNYANISIARSLKRAKEIGIRKVVGSQRRQIIEQFLVETCIVMLISVLLSTYIFSHVRKEFLAMVIGSESLSLSITPTIAIVFIGFAILTGLATGAFPALYFSKITAISALRSSGNSGKVSISVIRKSLMVGQFALTLIFMIGIGVVIKEYRHTLTYDFGFSKENILVVPVAGKNINVLRSSFNANPEVKSICFSSSLPGTPAGMTNYLKNPDSKDSIRVSEVFIDEHAIQNLGIKIAWGSSFGPSGVDQSTLPILVNEAFMSKVHALKWQDSLTFVFSENKKAQVIGVVQNFNHEPLNMKISPLVLRPGKEELNYALIGIKSNDVITTIGALEATWDTLYPNEEMKSGFLETRIEEAYNFIIIQIKIFSFLGFLAISISCLGLLGMVIYSTENRTKEVAIRKIMGASSGSLYKTLSGTFLKMQLIAAAIAIPIAYIFYDKVFVYALNKYSEGVGWIEVSISVAATLFLGAVTIWWQIKRVLRINPAVNLRNE